MGSVLGWEEAFFDVEAVGVDEGEEVLSLEDHVAGGAEVVGQGRVAFTCRGYVLCILPLAVCGVVSSG